MAATMNISQAAQAAGVSAKMIRHYEEIGLLPEAARSDAGYRKFGERDVSVLRFIRQSRRLGLSTPQIAELLGLWSDRSRASREVKSLALQHVDGLEQKMREMAEMKEALERLIAVCRGSDDPHCAILDGLAATSPNAPEPGSVGAEPRRNRLSARDEKARPRAAASTSHLDLTAWTHRAHADRL